MSLTTLVLVSILQTGHDLIVSTCAVIYHMFALSMELTILPFAPFVDILQELSPISNTTTLFASSLLQTIQPYLA